jgi:hypothetical protein
MKFFQQTLCLCPFNDDDSTADTQQARDHQDHQKELGVAAELNKHSWCVTPDIQVT